MSKQNQEKRILIVDDDEDDFFITSEYIKSIPANNFLVDWSYNYNDALKKLVTNEYDIYFVDYRLGIKTGMDLLNDAIQRGCEAPIILLTGKGTQEIDVKAMESGAYDYLIKSELNTEKLERCIRYSVERAASIQALKANERRYRSIFEKSKDIVFITDTQFKISEINYAATELLDYELDELIRRDIFSLFKNKSDRTYFADILDEIGEFYDYEVDLMSKKGEVKNCIISASIEINNNAEKYIQGIIHDNTSRKKAEKTSLQAEKLAATGRLVRTLAHEVRNPLNNINLSIEQLIQQANDDDSKLYLEIVQRNGKRIGDLITELLNSARLSSQINLHKISLQSALDNAISAAMDRMTLKRIDLQVSSPETDCFVLLDSEKIQLAFLNIIINAVEAMEEGVGVLKITITSTEDEHIVEITDNGSGISDENMSRLFEPYFTSKRNGMGLGLASTLNIVQSHNAHIDVKSEINQGTSFIIGFKKV
ncbi:hybrid sensor histidine kinase/response regulator [Segetibacter sp.]|jgi:PAS domain S-box-containing protein|uniref:hybrid sensor histidine kinase/response regulator n=1 Tax=Segetibacter sp. TaxID=2231182 RepID=UPI002634131E|nr:hybrid sensor histidine kinase/response regulator [Segetibacter sp.]MCW3078799.1 sensor hybrid histidine kinase [Segetibacter sp.]